MFCPKCGTENPEANKYCRACRENLKVISQAMKRRLAVVIASKLDQMLDSRSERFRRDGILWFLMGASFLLSLLVKWIQGSSKGLYSPSVFLSSMLLLFGVWEYLAYKRSLSPDFNWNSAEPPHHESTDGSITTLDLAQTSVEAGMELDREAVSPKRLPEAAPSSVTELTTRQPQAPGQRAGKKE